MSYSRQHRFQFLIPLLGVVPLMIGCAVCPNYKRPSIDVPGMYRGTTADMMSIDQAQQQSSVAPAKPIPSPASLGDEKWWEVFQDKELQNLIRTALKNNYDVRIAASRVLQAQAQLGITRADQLPSLSVGGSETNQNSPAAGPLPAYETTLGQVAASAAWNLDFWGRYRRATEAARATLLADEWARKQVVTTLVANVATDYFQLRALDLQLDISKRTLASRQDSLQLTQTKEQHGLSTLLDVRQAEQLVDTAQTTITDLERQITQQENNLSILLGNNPADIPRCLLLTEQPHAPEVPVGIPSSLLERRPDVREAEENLIAANAQIGVARAQYFPQISLTADAGFSELCTQQPLHGANWVVEHGGVVDSAHLPGRKTQEQREVSRSSERAVGSHLPTNDSRRISRCLERASGLPQRPRFQDRAGATGGGCKGCRAAIRGTVPSREDRLS